MEEILTGTLGAATVALVARIVFDWLKGRHENGVIDLLQKICEDVAWSRKIHERYDAAGNPVWYFQPSVTSDISKLAIETRETNQLLTQILEQLRCRPL